MHLRTPIVLVLCLLPCGGCGQKQKTTDELLSDLKGAGERDRIIAVRLLPDRKGDAARIVPALIAALKDPEGDVRRSAAVGLGTFGEQAKEAIPALQALESDRDPRLRISARQAVARIDPSAAAKNAQNSSSGK